MTRYLPWLRGATALMTLLLAALLCWQCIDIYLDGNAPENLDANGVHIAPVYTMADVGARLRGLVLPAGACVLLIAVRPSCRHMRRSPGRSIR